MKHSFFLVIPKQTHNPQRIKEFEESILKQWISQLPIANAALASRLIYDFILEFNGLRMSAQLRLEVLELLRPSFLVIEDYLRSRLVKSGFPKDSNDQKALKLLVALQRQVTIGYWIALKEITDHDVGWFQGKIAALSIHRSIKGLSDIVISYFIMGMPIPDWIWMDLHSLYKLSVKIKKNNTQVPLNDLVQNHKTTSTPEECYLQVILLSLADPTGLMQKEIKLVYDFIESISALVSLKSKPVANQALQCLILVGDDKPPYFETLTNPVEKGADEFPAAVLYIDFTQLYQAFDQGKIPFNATQARFSRMRSVENRDDKITTELLDYLEQRWEGIELKSSPLFSDRLDRLFAIGLMPLFKLQEQENTPAGDDCLEFLGHSVSAQLLSCVFKQSGVLSVGSLVSFRKVDGPGHMRILGVVNKLVVDKEIGKISFGLQFLADQLISATYLDSHSRPYDHPKNALLYHCKERKSKSYIIVDSFLLKEDEVIRLFIEQGEISIMLKKKKNIGLGYWQFECMKVTSSKM
ncbi:MAG: hypothetical protein PHR16_11530 [Methylovulum sp.]|nr:hypothetical protein [Methylovulum sp.]